MATSNSAGPEQAPRSAGTLTTMLRLLAGVLVLVVVAAISGALWLTYASPQTDVAAGQSVRVRIKAGSTTREIGTALLKAGVIGNVEGFALHARLAGADGQLKPGSYDVKTGMADGDVIALLESGPVLDMVSVTIPEGFRVDQIADRLEKDAGVSRSEFLKLAEHGAPQFAEKHPALIGVYRDSLEGYLFPKTYRMRKKTSARQAIEMMLDQFDRETADLDFSAAQARGLTPQQIIVIASMIERESKLDEERPLVSSVIDNRLRTGMRLKIDATIEYVLRDKRLRLSNADLYTKTPYNTYLHAGLPPGPISSPGIESIRAALAPADTQFIYYVLTGKDGSHTFTTNLADFLVAKKRSKEVFGR